MDEIKKFGRFRYSRGYIPIEAQNKMYEETLSVYPPNSVEGSLTRIQTILSNSFKNFLIERRNAEIQMEEQGFELKEMPSYKVDQEFEKWFNKKYPDFKQLLDSVGKLLYSECITVPTKLETVIENIKFKGGDPIRCQKSLQVKD